MTRVSHLLSPAVMGGAEQVVLAGCSAQRAAGARVTLRLLRARNEPGAAEGMAAVARAAGVEVCCIDTAGRFDASALAVLRAQVAPDDVVHAHGYKALAFAALAVHRPHARLFASFHGTTSHTPDVLRWERLERALFALTRRVFVPSRATGQLLVTQGVSARQLEVVENPVVLEAPLQPEAHHGRLLFLGRLSPEKGLDVLLQGLAHAPVSLRLDVAGDGPERGRLESCVEALGLTERVRFLGLRRDVAALLSGAGALVLPSWREGLPIAILEARVAGLPVLASRVGGVPAVVDDGVDGLLVEPGDVEGWRLALERFVASGEALARASKLRAAGVRLRFAPSRWAERTLSTYLAARSADQ